MKLKRRVILERIDDHIALLTRNCKTHELDRQVALKDQNNEVAAYNWGKQSGISDGITALKIIKEYLEQK